MGPLSLSGRCGLRNNHLSVSGIEPQSSSPKPEAMPTELSRILFLNSMTIFNLFFSLLSLFLKNKSRLKRSRCCLCVCVSPPY
jgi:hypothetical protein